jgi:hypothetical protein
MTCFRGAAAGELWGEYGALGFLRAQHPQVPWEDAAASARRVKAKQIVNYLNKYACLIG